MALLHWSTEEAELLGPSAQAFREPEGELEVPLEQAAPAQEWEPGLVLEPVLEPPGQVSELALALALA